MLRTCGLLYHPIFFRLKSRPQILQEVITSVTSAWRKQDFDGRDFVRWLPIWSRARLLTGSKLGVQRSDFFLFCLFRPNGLWYVLSQLFVLTELIANTTPSCMATFNCERTIHPNPVAHRTPVHRNLSRYVPEV